MNEQDKKYAMNQENEGDYYQDQDGYYTQDPQQEYGQSEEVSYEEGIYAAPPVFGVNQQEDYGEQYSA
ncbi:MAG: hypothetical protein GX786_10060, partial [Clostridiales bacterium]|nr:hypothetical protein [Clostridiales bacterium]